MPMRAVSVLVAAAALSAGVARAQDFDMNLNSDDLIAKGFRLTKTVKKPNARHWEYYVSGDETYVCDFGAFDVGGCGRKD